MIALFIILTYAQNVALQTQYVHLFRREANACQALFIVFEHMLAQALEIRIFIPYIYMSECRFTHSIDKQCD